MRILDRKVGSGNYHYLVPLGGAPFLDDFEEFDNFENFEDEEN
jgi:hypothetical protein